MSAPNGHAGVTGPRLPDGQEPAVSPASPPNSPIPGAFPPEKLRSLVTELEIPFDPSVIEWRVTNTSKDKARGQVIPYADQRAYTDRLNVLFTPAGWTRKYSVHTSPNFERNKDQKTVAKVFVTCELTIFGIGSHSATGEEWTDDENAGTSAEAQAFKRAASCFGLGRYLYYFTGAWVDLDERKRPKGAPRLFGWATPKGWKDGLRPPRGTDTEGTDPEPRARNDGANEGSNKPSAQNGNLSLIRQIEAMQKPLGNRLYRGLLKSIGRAWKPNDIRDGAVLQKVLAHMQSAERGLQRLQSALERAGAAPLGPALAFLKLQSLDHIESLDTLQKLVLALEAKAGPGGRS